MTASTSLTGIYGADFGFTSSTPPANTPVAQAMSTAMATAGNAGLVVKTDAAQQALAQALGSGASPNGATAQAAQAGANAGAAAQAAQPASQTDGAAPTKPYNGQKIVWNFITAPEEVSWTTSVAANRVDMFGTNSPPVIVGTKGMRDLTIGNTMIEGFTRSRTVEGRLYFLETLVNFTLNAQKGFVNVPVYRVFASEKDYGNPNNEEGGFFIIKDIRIKETMRDLSGYTTRAFADISLIQVPAYQVDTGVDQASASVNKATSLLSKLEPNLQNQTAQGTATQTPPAPAPAGQRAPTSGGGGTTGGGGAAQPARPAGTPAAQRGGGGTALPGQGIPVRPAPGR